MRRLLHAAPYLFAAAMGAAALAVAPHAVQTWQRITSLLNDAGPPPIEVLNQVGERDIGNPRLVIFSSDGAIWHRDCPVVQISRLWLLRDGSTVPANVEILSGPLKGVSRDPRYAIHVTPMQREPSILRASIPTWLDPREVVGYVTNGLVPDNVPCVDGWKGPWRITSVAIDPP
jgi:hypothetical protein